MGGRLDPPARAYLAAQRRAARPGLADIDASRFHELVASGRDVKLEGIRTPDLERIVWPDAVMGGVVRGVELVSVRWAGRKDRPATMSAVSFEDAILDPFDAWDAVLTDCTFSRCRFGLQVVGGVHRSALVGCTFRACTLGEWFVSDSRFERTRFEAIRSGTVSFRRSRFASVTFAGRPGLLAFDSCSFDGLDLANANPERLEIREPGRGSRAVMFDRPDHVVIACGVLPELLPVARSAVSARAFAAFEQFVTAFGPATGLGRIGRLRPSHVDVRPDDIVRSQEASPDERALLVELVRAQRVVALESP